MLNLVLLAARDFINAGNPSPRILVTHADTLVENPAISMQANADLDSIREFASNAGIDLSVHVARPSLNDHWAVKVIGGRDLPVFNGVGKHRKCSMDFKIKPQQKMVKEILKSLRKAGSEPVSVVGTRFDESSSRAARMESRGETADAVWTSENGDLHLTPVADWTTISVWQYLHGTVEGQFEAYTDFSKLIDLYRAGSDPEAIQVVNGVEIFPSRFGCCVCTAGVDKSMSWMLKNNPEKYGYMNGLHQLQKYLLNSQNDLARRNWVCFELHEGYAQIRPNTYGPMELVCLLQYCLTLDMVEFEATQGRPRFCLIPDDVLFAIDAIWSLQGHTPAYYALWTYRDIVIRGKRYDIPELDFVEKTPVPAPRYVYVNKDYYSPYYRYAGLDLVELDVAAFDNDSRCIDSKLLKDGRRVLDVPCSLQFEVNMEAAYFLLDYELDRLLDGPDGRGRRSIAYRHYITTGIISLAKGAQTSKADKILRRTMWKEDMGLAGLDPRLHPEKHEAFLAQSISKEEWKEAVAKTKAEVVELKAPAPAVQGSQCFLPGLEAA